MTTNPAYQFAGQSRKHRKRTDPASTSKGILSWIPKHRFGLSLFSAIVVFCLLIRYWSDIERWWRMTPDRAFAEFVIARGGALEIDNPTRMIQRPDEIPSGEFAIRQIALDGGRFVDTDLAVIAGRTDIQEVSLRDTQITDRGLQVLGRMAGLQRLDVSPSHITVSGTEHLRQKLPACTMRIRPDDNLVRWAFDRQLVTTMVIDPDFFTKGVRGRRQCTALGDIPTVPVCVLEIELKHLDDGGMAHFEGVFGLEVLRVENADLTDASLPLLRCLKQLRQLELNHAHFSEQGLQQLKESLPNLRLQWQDATPSPNH